MNPFEMNRIDLGGRVALVNGASRGIGEAIARGLAGCGAHVVLSSRSVDGVEPVAESIRSEGGAASVRACHAGRLEEIDALIESIDQEFGRLDILINNAATNPYYGPAADLPPDAFDKTVAVNLKGPYFMMSRAVPLMIRGGGGSIVNVASIAALLSMAGQAVYAMTKAGLVSLTRSFARERAGRGPGRAEVDQAPARAPGRPAGRHGGRRAVPGLRPRILHDGDIAGHGRRCDAGLNHRVRVDGR
jgi:NAD(P)-dependent dehydrogenase (short-subunit alcohol dehydrogenase family)